eukprot:gene44126-58847_t
MGINEAIVFSLVTGLGGVFLLGYYFNDVTVFVGAFPGAVAPMLGWTAVTGSIDAVAWILDDDYRRAGFYLLPSFEGRGKKSAFQ